MKKEPYEEDQTIITMLIVEIIVVEAEAAFVKDNYDGEIACKSNAKSLSGGTTTHVNHCLRSSTSSVVHVISRAN